MASRVIFPLARYSGRASVSVALESGVTSFGVQADCVNWPERGHAVSVVRLMAEISYDGGLNYREHNAIGAGGERPAQGFVADGSVSGFASRLRDPQNPNRMIRVTLEVSEPLDTRVILETDTRGLAPSRADDHHSVAFSAEGGGQTFTNANSFSFTIDSSASDRDLIVAGGWITGTVIATLTVTHNGDAVGSIGGQTAPIAGGQGRAELFERVNPDAGSQTVAGSFSANSYGHFNAGIYSGVDQADPSGVVVLASGNDTTPTANVSVSADEMSVNAVMHELGNTFTSNNTQRSVGAGFLAVNYWGGHADSAATGTVTHSWTSDTSANWAIVAAALHASGGASVTTPWAHRHSRIIGAGPMVS